MPQTYPSPNAAPMPISAVTTVPHCSAASRWQGLGAWKATVTCARTAPSAVSPVSAHTPLGTSSASTKRPLFSIAAARCPAGRRARAVYCVHQCVRPGDEHLVLQRQAVQRLYMHAPVLRGFPIGGGVRCGRLALGQNGYHLHTGVLQAARRHKPVAAVVAPAAEHRRGFQARHAGHQLPGGSCARVFHHAQVREPGRVGQALQFFHLGSRNFVHCILLACGPGARRFYQ